MQGKNPTKKQKILIKSRGLNFVNWLVCTDTSVEMVIKHRISNKYKTIKKVLYE